MEDRVPMLEMLILVDENNNQTGTCEKMEAHRKGKLHRAFSVFIFNSDNQLLLQKRAKGKYHSGGLWTNTCCSHPVPGEPTIEAAHRRLKEEMGFDCGIEEIFSFVYKIEFEDVKLYEHELDQVFIGYYNGEASVDPGEVETYKWEDRDHILNDMEDSPEKYTFWFRKIYKRVLEYIET